MNAAISSAYFQVLATVGVSITGAFAQVNLSLEPATLVVDAGGDVRVEVWARGETPQIFDGAEIALSWDASLLQFQNHDVSTSPYSWWLVGFPIACSFNSDLDDGDALYQCLAPLQGAAPVTDLRLTTLHFVAADTNATVSLTIKPDGLTAVAGEGSDVLGSVGGTTITIGSGGAGGGGGGGIDDCQEPADSPPIAVIWADPIEGHAPLPVNFDGSRSSAIDTEEALQYHWDFGDETTDDHSGPFVQHTYADVGVYTVAMKVTNPQGNTDTAEMTITVIDVDAPLPPDDAPEQPADGDVDDEQAVPDTEEEGDESIIDGPASVGSVCGQGAAQALACCFLSFLVCRSRWLMNS